jgi:hypothetical protein
MPAIRDDIIIKGHVLKGMFRAARHAAKKVERHGLLADCSDLDARLQAAYVSFRDTLQAVTEEMEKRVTNKVIPPAQP